MGFIDGNHLEIIFYINVSSKFSITVTEIHYRRLSCVVWIRDLMKILRLTAKCVAECVMVEQKTIDCCEW